MVKYVKASRMFDLPAEGTGRQSFYGKAKIVDDGNTATLYSYNTPVAKIVDGVFEELDYAPHSQTTSRHIKQFKKFYDIEASKKVCGTEKPIMGAVPDIAYECADIIAKEINKVGIMDFHQILDRIESISGKDYDAIVNEEIDIDVYSLLSDDFYENDINGTFFTYEYAKQHPEALEYGDVD
jgi:hypothetical protein